jgi:hypothetical protein
MNVSNLNFLANPVIEGQIGKLYELGVTIRNYVDTAVAAVTRMFVRHNVDEEVLDVLIDEVDVSSLELFSHGVVVNRNQTWQEALDGREQFVDDDAAASMPICVDEKVELHFFQVKDFVIKTFDDAQRQCKRRGLKLVDPRTLAAFNAANPNFAYKCPNCTYWQTANGQWCLEVFDYLLGGKKIVIVDFFDNNFTGYQWYAGVRPSLN